MGISSIVNLLQNGIWQIIKMVGPVLGAALIIGLIIAIFQATTSIQEQTMTFLPKLLTILIVIALLGSWMFTSLGTYTINLFKMIPTLAR